MLTIKLKSEEYELNTSLLVAFKWQGQHNHKPYTEIMAGISDLKVEDQINLIWVSFDVENPNVLTKTEFRDAVLREYGIGKMNTMLGDIIREIMFFGMSEDEKEDFQRKAKERKEGKEEVLE